MEHFNTLAEREETEEDVLNPKKELKCALVKTTLKSFVTQHVSKYYQAAAIRVMMPTGSKTGVWLARQQLEQRFSNEPQIVGFFSCATALYGVKKDEEQQTIAGVSFWVMFDWPDMAIESYECHLTKIVSETGLDIVHCKAVKGRGKSFFILFLFCPRFSNFFLDGGLKTLNRQKQRPYNVHITLYAYNILRSLESSNFFSKHFERCLKEQV